MGGLEFGGFRGFVFFRALEFRVSDLIRVTGRLLGFLRPARQSAAGFAGFLRVWLFGCLVTRDWLGAVPSTLNPKPMV